MRYDKLRRSCGRCRTVDGETEVERWERIYGTTNVGNLPQYKKNQHVGHCYAPCPYSTQSTDLRTEIMLGVDPSTITKVNHTGDDGRIYYMKTHMRISVWGYECTFDNCPYYLDNGQRYFYI